MIEDESDFTYDVALSFAGEDREYAKSVADYLRSRSANCFYDEYSQADLWGKNLQVHLHEIYSRRARFCVVFISQDYVSKTWTKHELGSAQERALGAEQDDYLLPVVLDDTDLADVPGLPSTTAHVDGRVLSERQVADLILAKLNDGEAAGTSMPPPWPDQPKPYWRQYRFAAAAMGLGVTIGVPLLLYATLNGPAIGDATDPASMPTTVWSTTSTIDAAELERVYAAASDRVETVRDRCGSLSTEQDSELDEIEDNISLSYATANLDDLTQALRDLIRFESGLIDWTCSTPPTTEVLPTTNTS